MNILRTLKSGISMPRQALDLDPAEPVHPALSELLKLRLELRRVQVEVIHRSDPQDAHSRKPAASPVHQIATYGTEAVFHGGARGDGLVLRPSGQFVLSTHVLERLVVDGEVGAEHGGA